MKKIISIFSDKDFDNQTTEKKVLDNIDEILEKWNIDHISDRDDFIRFIFSTYFYKFKYRPFISYWETIFRYLLFLLLIILIIVWFLGWLEAWPKVALYNYKSIWIVLSNIMYFGILGYIPFRIYKYIRKLLRKEIKKNLTKTFLIWFLKMFIFTLIIPFTWFLWNLLFSLYTIFLHTFDLQKEYHQNNVINITKDVITAKDNENIICDDKNINWVPGNFEKVDLKIKNKNFTNNTIEEIFNYCEKYVTSDYNCIIAPLEYTESDNNNLLNWIRLLKSWSWDIINERDFILFKDIENKYNIPLFISKNNKKNESAILKTFIWLRIWSKLSFKNFWIIDWINTKYLKWSIVKKISEKEFLDYNKKLIRDMYINNDKLSLKQFYVTWPKFKLIIDDNLSISKTSNLFWINRQNSLYIQWKENNHFIKIYLLWKWVNDYWDESKITINNKNIIVNKDNLPFIDFDHIWLIVKNSLPVWTKFYYNKLNEDFIIKNIEIK